MSLLNDLLETSTAERMLQLERIEKGNVIEGDFEGSVTGHWIRLGTNGGGYVSYNKKTYTTKPIGFTSLPFGTEVELSHANGVYYSKF
jgi:hypothetical protein